MPNIEKVDETNIDSNTKSTLEGVKAKLGMVPNLFATFANAPAVLDGYLKFSESLNQGELTTKQRELIALAVGQENQCEYCLSAHTAIGKGVGLTEQDITLARDGKAVDNIDNMIVKFAVEIVKSRAVINNDQLEALRSIGVNDTQIVEVIGNVALNLLTNYTNHIAATDIDFPRVELSNAA